MSYVPMSSEDEWYAQQERFRMCYQQGCRLGFHPRRPVAGDTWREKMTNLVIPPTIGRRVLVFGPIKHASDPLGQGVNDPCVPFDGGIAYVHSMGNHVPGDPLAQASVINVGYRDHNGAPVAMTSVKLLDRAQQPDDAHGKEWYAVWMPYQFEQALRAAAREQG